MVQGNSVNVSWLPPKYPNGIIDYYILLWRRNVGQDLYMKENVTGTHFFIEHLGA